MADKNNAMEVKNLFDAAVKQEIINRINKLTPGTKALWGKMNVGQMLAHLQMPIGAADGSHKVKRTLIGRLLGPMVKPILYNDKPFKRSLPTDPSFVMINNEKDFEKEKQKLLEMVGHFTEKNIVNEIHPFFGKMSKEQRNLETFRSSPAAVWSVTENDQYL
jgi:hypothetical protein